MGYIIKSRILTNCDGKRKFTVKRDKFDPRDQIAPKATVALPAYYSLEQWTPSVADQGQLGSCTAFTAVEMAEFLARKYFEWMPDQSTPANKVKLSELMQYWNERNLEGDVSEDAGASSRTMMKAAVEFGICPEALWPYDTAKFTDKPSDEAYKAAHSWKPGAYHRVPDVETLKSCIYSGYPVSLGLTLYDSFESDEVAKTGLVPMPGPAEQIIGGHEIWAFAYSDTKVVCGETGACKIRNHWGKSWGIDGNCWVPYKYLANPALGMDFWVMHFGKPWK